MKKAIFSIIALIILLTTSCDRKQQELPADLIPRDKMKDIIVDAWILENSIQFWYKDSDKLDSIAAGLYTDLFEKYDISKEQFINSSEFYLHNEANAEGFVKECIQRLDERRDEFTEIAAPASQPQ